VVAIPALGERIPSGQQELVVTKNWGGRVPTVAVIGAGFGGIGMGVRLKKAGIHSFTIFEKGADVGGIWRDNTYPGCCCDVPSHLYSFSFEKYRSATVGYPAQREILEYLHQVALKYGLHDHLRLNAEVTAARYDEDSGRWTITLAGGEQHTADVVVYAVGQLHRPRLPDIPGRDTFEGVSFHSARWNHDHDLTQRTVAVIGTGSSAGQLIPHVARAARRLHVFQRSASWVIPKPRLEFRGPTRLAFKHLPFLQSAYRAAIYLAGDLVLWPVVPTGWSALPVKWVARWHMRNQVRDERLRRKLTPDHPIGCKRIVMDSNYYPALNRDNVELVTERITRITPTGIETEDGTHREVDTIVYASGFRTTEFLAPMEIQGKQGINLHEQWHGTAQAYLGVAVPNFPNLFILHGPNSILGHNSNVFMIECQARYIIKCLRMLSSTPRGGLEVRQDAMTEYKRQLDRAIDRTVWREGCQSWYKTASGEVTNPWPGSAGRYQRLLRRPDRHAFHLIPAAGDAERAPTG
jgi:cation diffusion facilitator CzcD-associated flavoprotein CzcO